MHRLLLLGVAYLLAASAHGQHLLQEIPHHKHYLVYKETMTRYDINTHEFEDLSCNYVNYMMTLSQGGLQMRRTSEYKPLPSNTTGAPVCRLTGLKYLRHTYEMSTLFEEYTGVYQSYSGVTVPPLRELRNPSSVSVGWAVKPDGSYALRIRWYYGAKKNSERLFNQSYFLYTLDCKKLD